VKSCGFLVMKPDGSFLLMKHPNRYDLPKGHVEAGASERQTALRELREETGLLETDIAIDPVFRFEEAYTARYKRFGGEQVRKTLVIFLGRLIADKAVRPSEHGAFEWLPWTSPPRPIQRNTVDPLLRQLAAHLANRPPG